MSFDTALLTMADEIEELKAKVAKLEAEAKAIKSEPRELWGDAALVF